VPNVGSRLFKSTAEAGRTRVELSKRLLSTLPRMNLRRDSQNPTVTVDEHLRYMQSRPFDQELRKASQIHKSAIADTVPLLSMALPILND
jgi:hypothetical protein